jgi:SAM-dependent methyltransferase
MNITNYTGYSIDKYVKEMSCLVKPQSSILDAGSGISPYSKYFKNCVYHTADIGGNPTFKCSIDNIPMPDCSYDVILCTEVLEHVKYPNKVVKEFYRLLKPNGMLIMTLPQCFGEHSDDNYFNFLRNGLKLMFDESGFKSHEIQALGGIYTSIGKIIRESWWYTYRQHLNMNGKIPKLTKSSILLAPLFAITFPFARYIIPYTCYYLDKMDNDRKWTINYGCYAIK